MYTQKRPAAEVILNLIIVVFTAVGIVFMVTGKAEDGALQASGIENFKFYTVLTNVFCGAVSTVYLTCLLLKKDTGRLAALKLAAVCGVAVTFAVVAFFFGPLYGYPQFYQRGNLFFHLLLPVAAMAEFVLIRRGRLPFRAAVFAAAPTLLYGTGYMLNILINGMGGEWPDTNDFYAFLSWGWPVGILIFASITLSAFGTACLFRSISNKRSSQKSSH